MLTFFHVATLPTQVGTSYTLDGTEGHHAARVLRINIGEELMLSDGQGGWSRVRTLSLDKKSLDLLVLDSGREEASSIHLTVIQAVIKGERSKENIELLTQAGVHRIIPWQAARSIGKMETGDEKLAKYAREASKQSRRLWIPEISEVMQTQHLLPEIAQADLAIILHENSEGKLSQVISSVKEISTLILIVGPEGGTTDEEVELMEKSGAQSARLGSPIFRSAHAGVAGLSALNLALRIW